MNREEKKGIIECLITEDRERKLYHDDIPDKYKEDKKIIEIERQVGMRKIGKRGFDVIRQVFFVHEDVLNWNEYCEKEFWEQSIKSFEDFDSYYNYLNGDIYDNACYYQCNLSKITKKVDKKRFFEKNSFIDYNIDDYTFAPNEKKAAFYIEREKAKKDIKKWCNKFIACDTLEKLLKTVESYNRSALRAKYDINIEFFFWQYVFADLNDKRRFNIIMQYMSTGKAPADNMIKPLCHVYDPKDVLAAYHYSAGVKQTRYKHNRSLRDYVEYLEESEQVGKRKTKVFFDEKTHYYCERMPSGACRYFETFDELIRYRNYDLTNTDLTEEIKFNYDLSKCKIDESTLTCIGSEDDFRYVVKKRYLDEKFEVVQVWCNRNDVPVKRYKQSFQYFFDFVAFLKGDLSGADLLLCDGLQYIEDVSDIDFSGARIRSAIGEKLGIPYEKYALAVEKIGSFRITEEFEKETFPIRLMSEDLAILGSSSGKKINISYVTDLHLMHKILRFHACSKGDVVYVVRKIVNTIVKESEEILLIGGDVSSDFSIFELFVRQLRRELNRKYKSTCVIFTLGNHELWEFPRLSFDKITEKYKKLLTECRMFLLQNDILYMDDGQIGFPCAEQDWKQITTKELITLTDKGIREKLRTAKVILFGGLAFSGCNEAFNANDGIYRDTISRSQEKTESQQFKELYNKVADAVPDRELVIFTHMPMDCWSEKADYRRNYVYISGHTHRNYYNDDGEIRIYADNQIGYKNDDPHLKHLNVDGRYDWFADYDDGIYQISGKEYQRFFRGKNISVSFNREGSILHMLKKNGYYCFILQSPRGKLTILNGGAQKRLERNDIHYYYDNMDAVTAMLKEPLNQYTGIQEKVAAEIRKIGGTGRIHGCIVDIDWNNHVYINPFDVKITGYWAENMVYKRAYSSISALLKERRPDMYAAYKKLTKKGLNDLPALSKKAQKGDKQFSQMYLDTDIYAASREIRKMQKLNSGVLTVWYEVDDGKKLIGSK